ncbi:hypothetical protein [Haliea sp. E17]|uniref:hypothetical protein n=1 Tax=Haliea sp. E17 TaxID=3401576 RepID=UPI003AAD5316
MDAFNRIWLAPSIVLGLGIARLLSDAVLLFRSRLRAKMDWVPLIWAACIFLWQVQYLWAVVELPSLSSTWTVVDFALLLTLSLLLFLAGALVLPDSEMSAGASLEESFRQDGRWALVALSLWCGCAVVVNWKWFDVSPASAQALIMLAIASVPLVYLVAPSRKIREWVSIANIPLTLWAIWMLSPKSY